jgi:23S rRNA U2552 (ribose-2'-O)-methylase RlmE/FtsJ
MSSANTKPPWMRSIWYNAHPRLMREEYAKGPFLGEWEEETHTDVESLKEQIRPYDKTELWDLAKRITNPYELISTFSNRLKLPKSTCCHHPLSRSFFKMIEILNHLDFFTRHKSPKYRSLHVCEGPGGFIEAFQYLAKEKDRRIQGSYGMTLKSTHMMIPGWKRATQFLEKHKNVHILFGPSRTGNIFEPENQQACREAVGDMGAHLATADGGFDFSEDFSNQEKNMLRLLVNSAIILLDSVAVEGDIVLKFFDCNAQPTRDLIRILASCFQQWTLYKPVTSRPCNSEWYFLGKSAHRDRRDAIQFLKQIRDMYEENPDITFKALLETNSLNTFLIDLQRERTTRQIVSLQEVLAFCRDYKELDQAALWEAHREDTIRWCIAFRMPTEFKLKT